MEYIKIVDDLLKAEGSGSQQSNSNDSNEFESLLVTHQDNYTKIVLNRPTKKNAITREVSFL